MKVVIVEDEIRIREGLARLIKKLKPDYEIAGEAENGRDGYELICTAQPDLVITDIKMPLMDGLEMLSLLHREGIMPQVIVLSAYSEFEYARQAMRLGIREYILKPIVVGDISEALHHVEEELGREKKEGKDSVGSMESLFSGIIGGSLEADDQVKTRLRYYGISEDTTYAGICLYLGALYEREKASRRRELQQFLNQREQMNYVFLQVDWEQSLLVLIYGEKNQKELERWVQYWLLRDRNAGSSGAIGFAPEMKLENLKETLNVMLKNMDWSISLGADVLISWPKVTKLQTSPCMYPLELEHQMKLAVCTGEEEKIRGILSGFHRFFQAGALYHPREIKECYVHFLWAFLNTGKEVGALKIEGLEQQRLLELVMGARTSEELRQAMELLMEQLKNREEEATHLTIKRVQSLVQEFYQTGITLDEIAAKLNLTSEYLGTKFHREMGITFSTYIKNLRMKKAKELLIGTDLKLYEIARKVGYANPKYFSRVFKEETGQLPADYRRTHK